MATRTVQFTSITLDQFLAALKKAIRHIVDSNEYKNVHIVPDKFHAEHSYKIYTGAGSVYIHLSSSIHKGRTVCDNKGEDAIRVNLIDELSGEAALPAQSHVKRIDTWEKNLTARLAEMFAKAYTLQWCECGSPKREFVKRDKSGKFMGCVGWAKEHHREHFAK